MKKIVCFMLIVCLSAMYRPTVYAVEEGAKKEETLAPYFFIPGADPSVDRLPLKGTEVQTSISGIIAETYVTQTYANEGARPINASYVFPASTKVSVHGMIMQIGGQKIRAVIKEKEEAKQEFKDAKNEGKNASLLEEKRANVFTMDVANIMPGDVVRIELHYTEMVEVSEGICRFVFPTVTGPRYAGTVSETDRIEGDWVESPYLEEGIDPDSTYDITVNLSAGVPIADLASRTHDVEIEWKKNSEAKVTLSDSGDYAGNRDFILEYRMNGEKLASGLMLYEGEEENFFLLTVQPPARFERKDIVPREYLFVLDVSGSMNGYPLETAKELIRNMVGNLRETDCFNVFLFSDVVSEMSLKSVAATEENIRCALDLIDMQEGGGGTELAAALDEALQSPAPEDAARSVVVITDGYIYDEEEIFQRVRDSLGEADFFSFGIGSSVNRSLMEGIAGVGMGETFIVTGEEEAEETAKRFRTYIEAPVLTDIQVSFEGFDVYDTEPSGVPSLYAQKPVVLFGKWRGAPEGTIRVAGRTGDSDYVQEIEVSETESSGENEAIRYLWARKKVEALTAYGYAAADERTKAEITKIGLAHNMVTPYTSFVAVAETVRNPKGESTDVDQPLPLPQGVSNYAVGGYLFGAEPGEVLLAVLAVLALLAGAVRRRIV